MQIVMNYQHNSIRLFLVNKEQEGNKELGLLGDRSWRWGAKYLLLKVLSPLLFFQITQKVSHFLKDNILPAMLN